MGRSSPHPHGQTQTNSSLSNEAEREDRLQKTYFVEQDAPMLIDYAQRELVGGSCAAVETEY